MLLKITFYIQSQWETLNSRKTQHVLLTFTLTLFHYFTFNVKFLFVFNIVAKSLLCLRSQTNTHLVNDCEAC